MSPKPAKTESIDDRNERRVQGIEVARDSKSMITPCLWFDRQAEEAAKFYVSLFPSSHVDKVVKSPADFPSGKKGDVVSVDFTLMGRPFSGLNGGPYFKFNEAVSFVVPCDDQAEVDRYWKALSAVPEAEQCGWVKDRFGVSWQIVPKILNRFLEDPDRAKAGRVMEAMLKMKKLDIAALDRAARASGRPGST
jgi:predicted 3-demethylubiquinone-9 3-methyltransferase (glyoxalase superfamily)